MTVDDAPDALLAALRASGSRIRHVRYRENRSVLLSVSRDGRTLNSHACFRNAPERIRSAIVRFLSSRRGSAAQRQALGTLRGWDGARLGLEQARRRRPRRRPRLDGPETAALRTLFDALNAERFGNRLPAVGLRVSRRMVRTLGTIRYGVTDGRRAVREIALSADLLLPSNRSALRDTLLHEMAHAEAWLEHGHRGHGRIWKRIAARVGCAPRARTQAGIERRAG